MASKVDHEPAEQTRKASPRPNPAPPGLGTLSMQEQILVSLRRIIRAIDLHSRQLAQTHGLTGPQLVLLKEIDRFPALSTGELAQRVSLGQGTVSMILERLERKGLIRRERSEADRRRVINSATAEGTALVRKVPSVLQDRFVSELDKLADWERSLLLSSLQRVATMMQAEELSASPVLVSGPIDVSVSDAAAYLGDPKSSSPEDG
jgi:DNA-binding MarR family transcriptional regulator